MTIPHTPVRRSPVHDALEARGAEWRLVGGTALAVRLGGEAGEPAAHELLGLCDLSGLPKLGVKGRDAENWLRSEGLEVPEAVFGSRPLTDGGIIVRFAADEFFLEDDVGNSSVAVLSARFDTQAGHVIRVERQEATILVIGSRSREVMAQVCGINFREAPPQQVVFTRVAGVSCGVLPEPIGDLSAYRLWIDYSYAPYLWDTLVDICESLGGCVIGVGFLFPELPP